MASILTWTLPQDMLFLREKDKKTAPDGNVDVVMSGMVNMMNTLCQALIPCHTTREKTKYRIISYEKGRITQYLSKTIR